MKPKKHRAQPVKRMNQRWQFVWSIRAASLAGLLAFSASSMALTIVNGNFETGADAFVTWPGYILDGSNPPAIPGWLGGAEQFGRAGINPIVSGEAPFRDNGNNTTHVAFLQGATSLHQSVAGFTAGENYVLGVDYNARNCCGAFPFASISVDGNEIWNSGGPIAPVGDANPWYHLDIPFVASAQSLTISLSSQAPFGGDSSLLLENVTVNPEEAAVPEGGSTLLLLLPAAICLPGFKRRLNHAWLIGWSWKTKAGAVLTALAALAAFTVFTAAGDEPTAKPVRADIDKSALIAGPVYDKDGNLANGDPPLPGNTLLWGNNYGLCPEFRPITSLGRQITLAEYSRLQGTASMKSVAKGTHVVIHLSGLIPNGVYSILVLTYGPPGFTPDFSTWIGEGALGSPSQNGFVASATGHAQLSVIHPPGDLSTFGTTGYLLDEAETQLLVALHLDDQIQDPPPGEHCTLEIPGVFRFQHPDP